MKAPIIFGLLVRSVGVFLLYQLITGMAAHIVRSSTPHGEFFEGGIMLQLFLLAIAATWFLFGAPPIQGWAYPKSTESRNPAAPAPEKPRYDGPPCVSCGEPTARGVTQCPHCGWTQP